MRWMMVEVGIVFRFESAGGERASLEIIMDFWWLESEFWDEFDLGRKLARNTSKLSLDCFGVKVDGDLCGLSWERSGSSLKSSSKL